MKGKNAANNFEYYVPERFSELLSTVKKFLSSPEPGVILSAPLSGTSQRIDQMVQDHAHEFDRPTMVLDVKETLNSATKLEVFCQRLNINLYKDRLNIIVKNCDHSVLSREVSILDKLIHLHIKSTNIRVIFFFQINILSEEVMKIYKRTKLYSQIYYYPSISVDEAYDYLMYLISHWGLKKLPLKSLSQIVKSCGNQVWLLSNAIREYRHNLKIDFSKYENLESTQFRLEHLASHFSNKEIEVLMGNKQGNSSEYYYLSKIGLINKDKCNVPLLSKHLSKKANSNTLRIYDSKIYTSNINLQHSFTHQERILLLLLLNPKHSVVTRDDIADALWDENSDDKFSVWAIEQLIRRLRKKLLEMNILGSKIKTIRGEGYQIE